MTKTNDTINPSHYWGFDGKRGTGMTTDEYWHTIAESYREKPQEPFEDAISRQAAIDAINRLSIHDFAYEVKTGWIVRYDAVDELRQLPSVNPKQRTGHWIECEDEVKCFCSECKEISDYPTKFCPHCGAKMEEMQEEGKK